MCNSLKIARCLSLYKHVLIHVHPYLHGVEWVVGAGRLWFNETWTLSFDKHDKKIVKRNWGKCDP